MSAAEPGPVEVERAVADLLREQEVGALATVRADGTPSVAMMHVAADGVQLYMHLFTATRTWANLMRESRVACSVTHLPPGGMAGARDLRAVQLTGVASVVTSMAEVTHAVDLSRRQFPWMRESRMYDHVERAVAAGRQAFVRLDPVEALWTDNRVRMMWRRVLRFAPGGRSVTVLEGYPPGDG